MPQEDPFVSFQEMPRHVVVDDRERRWTATEEATVDPQSSGVGLSDEQENEGKLGGRSYPTAVANGLEAKERENPTDLPLRKPAQ